MANKLFSKARYQLVPEVVDLWAKVTWATGAGTGSGNPTCSSPGIKSVVRDGTGVFTFSFGDPNAPSAAKDTYPEVLFIAQPTFKKASAPSAGALEFTTDSITAGAVTVTLRADEGGSAADPANGEIGYFHFVLRQSSASR